ncbi:MAG: prepilin-type N-terminal cleavage/methylation domain-containing protein [Verrucomicrobiae bacterium]|nr:prepilin-type N-terminal cleavage/methylation domain-containing protein [Verrucomicrobiae bacterium]
MKLFSPLLSGRRRERGMTLPEVMVTSAIFGMALAGFMGLQLFALRYDQTVKMKLKACNDARNAQNRVAADIRSAGRVRIGNGDSAVFIEAPFGQRQEGNAIEIYPNKADTNNFIRYFCDPSDDLLKRYVNNGTEVILARSVTNQLVFTSEDGFGRILSNNFNNRVIGMTLQFSQDQSGGPAAQNGFLYDYYQLQTKVTRRALE